MENTITYTDVDASCQTMKPILDTSKYHLRDISDISNTFFREHFEGKEILYGQTIREYFYLSGSPGPPAPAKGQTDTFFTVYSTLQQKIEPNASVLFEKQTVVQGSSGYTPTTSHLYVWKPGFYHVYTNLSPLESCQFSLFKNNMLIPGTTFGSLVGSSSQSGMFIIHIVAEDFVSPFSGSPYGNACVLQLRNQSANKPVFLYDATSLGYKTQQIVASITLFLLHAV